MASPYTKEIWRPGDVVSFKYDTFAMYTEYPFTEQFEPGVIRDPRGTAELNTCMNKGEKVLAIIVSILPPGIAFVITSNDLHGWMFASEFVRRS